MDAVYIYKSTPDDYEIRYSLRSLATYAPWIQRVSIVGDCPNFFNPHEHISTKLINPFELMYLTAIASSYEDYLFMSDDFILLKPLTIKQAKKHYYTEDLKRVPRPNPLNAWQYDMFHTCSLLDYMGLPALNFETHIPTYMTRKWAKEGYQHFKDYIVQARHFGPMGTTCMLNLAMSKGELKAEPLAEANVRCGSWQGKRGKIDDTGKLFFNFDEPVPEVKAYLEAKFPEKCKYES